MNKIFNPAIVIIAVILTMVTMIIFASVNAFTSTACEPYHTGQIITHKTGTIGVIETCDVIREFVVVDTGNRRRYWQFTSIMGVE